MIPENADLLFPEAPDNDIPKLLELHFSFIGKAVNCCDIKRFLPGLADPDLEIHVPTPITVHLDNCQECQKDLEIIKALNLSHDQLIRLGQFFSDEPALNSQICIETQKAIPFVARLDFMGLPPQVINHLCVCSYCHKALTNFQNANLKETNKIEKQPLACDQILDRDIFDFVMPYGLDFRQHQLTNPSRLFITHIANCPDCISKLQHLYNILFKIFTRPNSATVTRFQINPSKAAVENESSEYQGRPILVDVKHKSNAFSKIQYSFNSANLTRLIKPAAAVILFSVIFYFLAMPNAHAVALADIYNSVAKVTNIHITGFGPDKSNPTWQQWVSESLKLGIIKTSDQIVFWDVNNHLKKTRNLVNGNIETNSFSDDTALQLSSTIAKTMGLLPFKELTDIPENAKWERITADKSNRIYELTWFEKSNKTVLYKKWRVFLDQKNDLPQKIEWYQKFDDDKDYSLKTYIVLRYPSDTQVQAIIRDYAF